MRNCDPDIQYAPIDQIGKPVIWTVAALVLPLSGATGFGRIKP